MAFSLLAFRKETRTIPVLPAETREILLHFERERIGFQDDRELLDLLRLTFSTAQSVSTGLLTCLQKIHKHLQFWQVRAQGSEAMRLRFMLLERGPWALMEGVSDILSQWWPAQGQSWASSFSFSSSSSSSSSHSFAGAAASLSERAVAQISARVAMLTLLQERLSAALGETHRAVERLSASVAGGKSRRAITVAIAAIHEALLGLEDAYILPQREYAGSHGISTVTLQLPAAVERQPLVPSGRELEWDNAQIREGVVGLLDDVARVEAGLSALAAAYRRPGRTSRHWIRYTGTAVGLGVVAAWALRHSRLAGSDDFSRWSREAYDSAAAFSKEHVEGPLVAIRDELFATFRNRPRGITEKAEVELTQESLRKMLVSFTEQVVPGMMQGATDQAMMGVVMDRYEKEMERPLWNLLGGDLVRALLIQVQRLKLDVETAMLELDQVMRANEINFALLAALPALLLTVGAISLLRNFFLSQGGAEGRGRAAQLRRRMLMADAEAAVLAAAAALDKDPDGLKDQRGTSSEAGMIVFFCNRLYKAIKRPATLAGEWESIRRDIFILAQTDTPIKHKVFVAARMERIYECLATVPKLQ